MFKSNESDNDGEDENNNDSKNSMKKFDALESPFSKLLKSSWDSKHCKCEALCLRAYKSKSASL